MLLQKFHPTALSKDYSDRLLRVKAATNVDELISPQDRYYYRQIHGDAISRHMADFLPDGQCRFVGLHL